MKKIDVSGGIDINKISTSKEYMLIVIGILKMLVINLNCMFVINAMRY